MINVAVVGLGWWGQKLADVGRDSEHVRVTRGVTRRPHAVADYAAGCGFPITADYQDALDDPDIDAVVLATPNGQHEEQVARAAEAGKHVFCEKPIALTKQGVVDAVERCRANGLVLAIGHERRLEPPMAEMLEMARGGELGTILQIEANFSHDKLIDLPHDNWRLSPEHAPAAGMTATGIHMFDLATAILGEARAVWASCETLASDAPNGDSACALVKYANGATAFVSAMMATPFLSRFGVYGRKGWIEIRDKAHIESPQGWIVTKCMAGGDAETTEVAPTDPVRDHMEAFARAVEGSAPYPITPEEMIANAAVMEAIFESARTGALVPVR
jgi:predicted dehydrogenase